MELKYCIRCTSMMANSESLSLKTKLSLRLFFKFLIPNEINEIKKWDDIVLLMGDFNAKIGKGK